MTNKQEGSRQRSGKAVPADLNGSPEKSRQDNLSEISQALKKDADKVCTESIPERILENIRKQIDGKKKFSIRKRRMITRPWLIRLALLAVCAVLFLGLAVTSKKKGTEEKPLRPDRTGSGPSYAEFIVRPASKSQQYRTPAAFSSSISPLESRFRGNFFWVFDEVDTFLLPAPGIISGRTTQLWTSGSFDAVDLKSHLSGLCKELQIGERQVTRIGNALRFSAKLNARQAAVLVKQLAAWGLIPVSRSGPLPDRYLYLGSGGEQVDLTMTILMKDRGGTGILSRKERDLFLGQGDPSGRGR